MPKKTEAANAAIVQECFAQLDHGAKTCKPPIMALNTTRDYRLGTSEDAAVDEITKNWNTQQIPAIW
eukprot:NODE_7470_length_318_cov_44.791822_g6732_i0.p1 GENE.NODE_7470_length_318_cov_44.791822_g6732_i0~~NODE_7470_length_318_cov_44.791822_g6732_i0.p1  ORF type:complete len:67 (-),score=13.24 NODE_7470_length_318_cov_44.791822_g6732_i0:89-289(-)